MEGRLCQESVSSFYDGVAISCHYNMNPGKEQLHTHTPIFDYKLKLTSMICYANKALFIFFYDQVVTTT